MVHKGQDIVITSVDLYGFCGREYHPSKSDIGVVGEVVSIHVESESWSEEEETWTCFKVLTREPEPRFLEVMDFECEPHPNLRNFKI